MMATWMKTLLIAGAAVALSAGAASSAELVTNGDFSAGNTGFTSSYTFSPGDLWGAATYDVDTNPHNDHMYFDSFGDHTTGTGKMLELNGSPTDQATIWAQGPINVLANSDYTFSFWITSMYSGSPANLSVDINGSSLGDTGTISGTTGLWTQYSYNWNSGANTVANLALWNHNLEPGGNDFALDDISFQGPAGVPEPATWAMMIGGFFGLGAALRRSRRADKTVLA